MHSYSKRVNSCSNNYLVSISSSPRPIVCCVAEEVLKRGEYLRFCHEEKAMIVKYASEHGVSKALKHYNDKNV